jgi:hypothetical protein
MRTTPLRDAPGRQTKQVRKQFFFEKKNQKTFDRLTRHRSRKSFLFLFSKKKYFLTSLPPALPVPRPLLR